MALFRPPLASMKTQVVTRRGVSHWKRQRISAVTLAPLGIWLLIEILRHIQADYPTVLAWASQPWVVAALAVFVGLVFYHSALGLQVVIEDYVSQPFRQMLLVTQAKAVSLIMAVLCWGFIMRIAIIGNG